ncbi:MAG TPA: sodium:solute symporter, partial [Desulfobacteraceae bacterium]|nr:sodium:solute symporter [Desulfobacteraceae bacterium]
WGSVFVQDVLLPFRRKPLSPKEHIKWLRWSIFGVAVFIFLFSLLFKQTEYIIMFFNITGAIFIGGAGSVIIGGLYWKRGTTAGAWAGMIVGAMLAVGSIIIKQIHELAPFKNEILAYIASLNGTILSFFSATGAIIGYVVFSLVSGGKPYNLDKMLNRGKYAIKEDSTEVTSEPVKGLAALLGMGKDFNRRDRIIYMGIAIWTATLVAVFVIGTIYNLTVDVEDSWWVTFWKYYLWVFFIFGSVTTVWFTIGGIIDMRKMFDRLKRETIDETDDGRVFHDNES